MVKELLFGESEQEAEPVYSEHGPFIRGVLAIRRSFLLFTIFLGFLMIVSGIGVESVFANQGVLAAMLLIWGISAIVFGAVGYGVVIVLGLR